MCSAQQCLRIVCYTYHTSVWLRAPIALLRTLQHTAGDRPADLDGLPVFLLLCCWPPAIRSQSQRPAKPAVPSVKSLQSINDSYRCWEQASPFIWSEKQRPLPPLPHPSFSRNQRPPGPTVGPRVVWHLMKLYRLHYACVSTHTHARTHVYTHTPKYYY